MVDKRAKTNVSMPVVGDVTDFRRYMDQVRDQMREELKEELRGELARLKGAAGHLHEGDIQIGAHVAARLGPKNYVRVEVTDILKSDVTGAVTFEVRRLDGGRKGLGKKDATDLFPPELAKS